MWKLTIEDDEGKQTSLPLAHDEYGVGRAEDNAIRLTDRNVSRKHASLKKNGQGWFIHDLSSYNGTYVNGARVAGEQLIANGDVVQLGDYRLELIDESIVTQPGAGNEATPAQGYTPPLPVHHRPNRLVVVVGPTPGAEFPLDRDYFSIGRAEDATISINHSSVSRLHAELMALGNGRFEIVDKGSANGIRINGVELRRGILEAGDALELGDVRMRFVGAGKIFRAGVDQSQQLAAVAGGFESVAPSVRAQASPSRRPPSLAKFIGIGVGVGVLVIVAVMVAMRPSGGGTGTPESTARAATEDVGAQLLKEARALAGSDLEGAHKKLLQVPENSPTRDDAAFKDIEAKWADSMFAKSDTLADPIEKRRVLQQISTTPSVDAERRMKASKLMGDLPEPATPEPTGGHWTPPPGWVPPPPRENTGVATGPAAPTKTTDPTPVGPTPPDGAIDNASIKRQLMPKLASGKISLQEAMMLKAACRALGDSQCRDAASAAIAKKKKESGN